LTLDWSNKQYMNTVNFNIDCPLFMELFNSVVMQVSKSSHGIYISYNICEINSRSWININAWFL